ncbi:hypothetical protein PR001_g23775 [Phytophthora rubi]|uniref:Uncharacterized protein n=1 Tax=Phytophthora rubi TaxID=129364 RepID=A0A6A3IGY9_9STRA|nr:hypothetical protein PR001_g23775 [Phytophthora rubi]
MCVANQRPRSLFSARLKVVRPRGEAVSQVQNSTSQVRRVGAEIEQLQEHQNDLNRTRENAEYELLLTETSLARATEALQQAESRVAELAARSSGATPTPIRRIQERDDA